VRVVSGDMEPSQIKCRFPGALAGVVSSGKHRMQALPRAPGTGCSSQGWLAGRFSWVKRVLGPPAVPDLGNIQPVR